MYTPVTGPSVLSHSMAMRWAAFSLLTSSAGDT